MSDDRSDTKSFVRVYVADEEFNVILSKKYIEYMHNLDLMEDGVTISFPLRMIHSVIRKGNIKLAEKR